MKMIEVIIIYRYYLISQYHKLIYCYLDGCRPYRHDQNRLAAWHWIPNWQFRWTQLNPVTENNTPRSHSGLAPFSLRGQYSGLPLNPWPQHQVYKYFVTFFFHFWSATIRTLKLGDQVLLSKQWLSVTEFPVVLNVGGDYGCIQDWYIVVIMKIVRYGRRGGEGRRGGRERMGW